MPENFVDIRLLLCKLISLTGFQIAIFIHVIYVNPLVLGLSLPALCLLLLKCCESAFVLRVVLQVFYFVVGTRLEIRYFVSVLSCHPLVFWGSVFPDTKVQIETVQNIVVEITCLEHSLANE